MKKLSFDNLGNVGNGLFLGDITQISQKISQILPFSKIEVLYFSNEFFCFSTKIKGAFLQNGLTPIEVIVNDNFSAEKDKFADFLSLSEDVRGVVAFNKKLLPLICSNYLNDKTTFFIEQEKSAFGLVQNGYYVKDCDWIENLPRKKQLYIMFDNADICFVDYVKSACVYTTMLIDYVFRQTLLNERLDTHFFNKAKALLVDALFLIKKKEAPKSIIKNLICLDTLLSKEKCFYSCSAVISSFIAKGDFFDLDISFSASKFIVGEYEKHFNKTREKDLPSFREIAKTLSFITGLNQNKILIGIEKMLKRTSCSAYLTIKQEIAKLILLYKDFAKLLDGKNLDEQDLHLYISLSGFTPFGTNGMSHL